MSREDWYAAIALAFGIVAYTAVLIYVVTS